MKAQHMLNKIFVGILLSSTMSLVACKPTSLEPLYSQALSENSSSCLEFFVNKQKFKYMYQDNTEFLCNSGYAVLYSNTKYVPIYVVEKITSDSLVDTVDRSEDFRPDTRVSHSSDPHWYIRSGYDKGHMAPAQDLSVNAQMMSSSFLMTNMVPQRPELNRKTWNMLESSIRRNVKKYNETAYVVSGPVFENNQPLELLQNKVWVPHYTFKVITYAKSHRQEAYMVPNVNQKLGSFKQYAVNLHDIEKRTGLTFN